MYGWQKCQKLTLLAKKLAVTFLMEEDKQEFGLQQFT